MKQTILVVDDDRLIRAILVDLLRQAGFEVVTAVNGVDGLETARKLEPDVVLLDLYMPELDGAEVCRRLRQDERFRYRPILMLTSRSEGQTDLNPFQLGADDFLAKPVEPFDLVSRIRACQAKAEALKTMEQQSHDYRTLVDISASISSCHDTREILQHIVNRIASHLEGIDRCSIALIQRDEEAGYVLASSDDDQLSEIRLALNNYPEIRKVMEDGQPLRVRDVDTDPLLDEVRPLLAGAQFDALLVCPVHCRDEVVGVMIVRAERAGEGLSDKELAFCQLVADVSAPPLRAARSLCQVLDESEQLRKSNRELNQALRLKSIFHDLFNNASEGLLAIDGAGEIAYANHAARRFLRLDQNREGGLLSFLVPNSRRRALRYWFQRQRGKDECSRFDITVQNGVEAPRVVSVSVATRVSGNGLMVVSFRDVTAKRAMETELRQTRQVLETANRRLEEFDRMRAEFLNTATHELRVPVTIIHGYCSLLQELPTENLTEQQREFLDAAVTSSDKLVDLVNNMLDISRLESGTVELDLAPRSLHNTIAEACETLQPLAENAELLLDIPSSSASHALYDEDQIQRVLVNLIGNAIKFTPPGGEIRVLVDESDSQVRVTVEDSGSGLPADRIDELFHEFTQFGDKENRSGTGLGLAICKRIVAQHRGDISAENRSDCGSRFSFTLPRAVPA